MSKETYRTMCWLDDFSGAIHSEMEDMMYYDGVFISTRPPICKNITESTLDAETMTKVDLPKVYGNVDYALDAYKVLAPFSFVLMLVLIAVCFTVFFLHYKRTSPISDSVYAMLINITIFNFLTITGSFIEHTYLYQMKTDFGVLPFDACGTLYGLEKISQICHAVSVWLTASMCVQKCICVCKPFAANRIVSIKAAVFLIVISIILGTAPFVVYFVDSSFIPYTFTVDDDAGHTFITCRRKLASFIADPLKYLRTIAWISVLMTRVVPCFIILVTSIMIIVELRKKSKVMRKMSQNHNQPSMKDSDKKTRVAMLVFFVAMVVFCVEVSTSIVFVLYIIHLYEDVDILDTEKVKKAAFGIDIVLYLSYVIILMSYCLTPSSLKKFKKRLTELTGGHAPTKGTMVQ